MPPCVRHGFTKKASHWDTPRACWSATPRPVPRPGTPRLAWPGSGAAGVGQGDPGPGAISLGYGSRKSHTRVALRLGLPKAWTQEKARLANAGVPRACRGSRTRHQRTWEMLATNGAAVPHRWMAGEDERGRPS